MCRSRQRGGPAEREADTKDSCGTRHTAAQTTATWHCSYVSAALFKVTDCPTNLEKGLTAAALLQMKWVIQMATPDTQAFEGEWMSGTKQVTCGVDGIFLTPKKRATDCMRSHTHAHADARRSHTHAQTIARKRIEYTRTCRRHHRSLDLGFSNASPVYIPVGNSKPNTVVIALVLWCRHVRVCTRAYTHRPHFKKNVSSGKYESPVRFEGYRIEGYPTAECCG
jgi:hypothetical protein